jgi:hypothetical protein
MTAGLLAGTLVAEVGTAPQEERERVGRSKFGVQSTFWLLTLTDCHC